LVRGNITNILWNERLNRHNQILKKVLSGMLAHKSIKSN
jgi:hypothetical protein